MTFWGSEQTEGKCVITDTHRQTTYTRFMTSSPLSRPLTCMFALPITNTLTLYPSSSSLPVNNSDQSVGLKEDSDDRKGKRRRRRRTYQRVCPPQQTVAFDTVSLHATASLGDFFWLFTLFTIRAMLRHTSVWLIACSFSFTWQLAAKLVHYFESMVEWDRYKVSPTLLCGHDVWTALAMFSDTDVRKLHRLHADDHCMKQIHIHSVVWRTLKLVQLDCYWKEGNYTLFSEGEMTSSQWKWENRLKGRT